MAENPYARFFAPENPYAKLFQGAEVENPYAQLLKPPERKPARFPGLNIPAEELARGGAKFLTSDEVGPGEFTLGEDLLLRSAASARDLGDAAQAAMAPSRSFMLASRLAGGPDYGSRGERSLTEAAEMSRAESEARGPGGLKGLGKELLKEAASDPLNVLGVPALARGATGLARTATRMARSGAQRAVGGLGLDLRGAVASGLDEALTGGIPAAKKAPLGRLGEEGIASLPESEMRAALVGEYTGAERRVRKVAFRGPEKRQAMPSLAGTIEEGAAAARSAEEYVQSLRSSAPKHAALTTEPNPGQRFLIWLNSKRGGRMAANRGSLRKALFQYKDPQVRKWFEEVAQAIEVKDGRQSLRFWEMDLLRREMAQGITREAKKGDGTVESIGRLLDKARRQKDPSLVPEGLRPTWEKTTDWLDNLQSEFADVLETTNPGKAKVIRKSLGEYLHTSYAAHNEANWARSVQGTAAESNLFDLLKAAYPGYADEEIQGIMAGFLKRNPRQYKVLAQQGLWQDLREFRGKRIPTSDADWLAKKEGIDAMRRAGVSAKDIKVAQAEFKQYIPEAMRQYLGINEDFVLDFTKTAALLTNDLEATRFLRNLTEEGIKNGTIRFSSQGRHQTPIVLDRLSEGSQFFVTEEMANALDFFNSQVMSGSQLRDWVAFLNGITKYNKVVVSIPTQMRNAFSIPAMWVMSGSLITAANPLANTRQGLRAAKLASKLWKHKVGTKALPKLTKADRALRITAKGVDRDLRVAHELNLVNTGVYSGEMEIWAEQVGRMFQGVDGREASRLRHLGFKASQLSPVKALQKLNGVHRRSYTATDDAGKTFSWLMHRERFSNLVKTPADEAFLRELYGAKPEGLTLATELEYWAAEAAKETIQHFPRTSPLGKQLSANPLVGTFPSFSMEMPRNMLNSLQIGRKELAHGIQHGRAGWATSGLSRIGGVIAVTYGVKNFAAWSADKYGMGREEIRALRNLGLYEYNRNSDIAVTGRNGNELTYLDFGYSNPYSVVNDLLNAALGRSDDPGEAVAAVVEELENEFLGREIFLGAIIDLITNTKASNSAILDPIFRMDVDHNGQVYNREDQFKRRQALRHILRSMAPGNVTYPERLVQSEEIGGSPLFGALPKRETSQVIHLLPEIMTWLGMPRSNTVDLSRALRFKLYGLGERRRDIASAYNKQVEASPAADDLIRTKKYYSQSWVRLQQEVQGYIHDARLLGLNDETIRTSAGSIFGAKYMDAWMKGQPVEFEDAFRGPASQKKTARYVY